MMSLRESRLPFDVLFYIVQSLDSNECRVFSALARTCKALSDPALARLWHTQDSIIPLLLLVPVDYRVTKGMKGRSVISIRKDALVALRKRPSQLARMIIYAKRVKRFHGLSSPKFKASNETVQFLLLTLPSLFGMDFTFPNLTELSLTRDEMSWSSDIFRSNPWNPGDPRKILVLLAPGIRHFAFNVSDDWSSRSCVVLMVVEALQRCKQLRTLSIVSTVPPRDNNSPLPVVINLRTHFKTSEALEGLVSLAAQSTSLEDVTITTQQSSHCMDLVAFPSTVHILGQFKSIRRLSLSLDAAGGTDLQVISPGSILPELRHLKLRLISPSAATWFLDSIASTKIEGAYFALLNELSIEFLHQFISSLEQFKSKLSHVHELSIRARVHTPQVADPDPALKSMIATTSQLFPHICKFKLKLFETDSQIYGYIKSSDLPIIARPFPELEVLKVTTAPYPHSASPRDVVSLAHEFPKLQTLGLTFDCGEASVRFLSHTSGPSLFAKSGLRVLKVRVSEIASGHEADVAAYLRRQLPHLRSVKKSQHSQWFGWDRVHRLLR